ncbi:hypothetical protein WN51_03688 [Melipona quadrifasciata]|uniref:Uncharacterized protein n=1 Tax=Melipona quadrifasciata TaxID=166423 RepID=A0A0M8ZT69_9HYME|nr:hypothetical protein WN51_03688 [Melipona quadrifasciata]
MARNSTQFATRPMISQLLLGQHVGNTHFSVWLTNSKIFHAVGLWDLKDGWMDFECQYLLQISRTCLTLTNKLSVPLTEKLNTPFHVYEIIELLVIIWTTLKSFNLQELSNERMLRINHDESGWVCSRNDARRRYVLHLASVWRYFRKYTFRIIMNKNPEKFSKIHLIQSNLCVAFLRMQRQENTIILVRRDRQKLGGEKLLERGKQETPKRNDKFIHSLNSVDSEEREEQLTGGFIYINKGNRKINGQTKEYGEIRNTVVTALKLGIGTWIDREIIGQLVLDGSGKTRTADWQVALELNKLQTMPPFVTLRIVQCIKSPILFPRSAPSIRLTDTTSNVKQACAEHFYLFHWTKSLEMYAGAKKGEFRTVLGSCWCWSSYWHLVVAVKVNEIAAVIPVCPLSGNRNLRPPITESQTKSKQNPITEPRPESQDRRANKERGPSGHRVNSRWRGEEEGIKPISSVVGYRDSGDNICVHQVLERNSLQMILQSRESSLLLKGTLELSNFTCYTGCTTVLEKSTCYEPLGHVELIRNVISDKFLLANQDTSRVPQSPENQILFFLETRFTFDVAENGDRIAIRGNCLNK